MKKVISTEKYPIKLWLDNIEEGALKQAEHLANLPFVFKHIAIMPDSHQGYGMPIGGVLAVKNVIIPNAVGVDIGCFSGDTKILLLNGLQKTLKELTDIGKEIFVYSLDENLKLVAGKAIPKLTRRNAELIEITISGGEVIKCTPDHKFMLLSGSYKEARDLKIFDSLMPLYRTYQSRDGYERVSTISGNGVLTHKMVAEQFYGTCKADEVVHHIDKNWYNNSPENLVVLKAKEHSKLHQKDNPIFGTDEFQVKRLATLKKNGFYNKKYSLLKKEVAIKNLEEYNNGDAKKEQDKLAGKRGAEFLVKYNKSEKGRAKSSENGRKYGFGKSNHKVLFTKFLSAKEDVYCLTVEKYHNFALSVGMFVHNCGMSAVKTSLTELDAETLKKIMGEIRKVVPVGFEKHKEEQDGNLMSKNYVFGTIPIITKEWSNALKSLGTLGGGNHFIEIQKGNDGYIWIMIHSGSRNLGKQVADYYNKIAIGLNEKWHSSVPKEWELAFLPIDTEEGQAYIREMNYCVEFALANRKLMMDRIIEIFENEYPKSGDGVLPEIVAEPMINIAHNYARMENHYSENVFVHRKGATLATQDTIGIIPGSQGTKSYIVKGKGNPESFNSCSHGAGRKMGRKEAERTLNLEEEVKKLNDLGVIHAIRGVKELDEAPGAYKDVKEVMANQVDLVEILVELSPLAVIKG